MCVCLYVWKYAITRSQIFIYCYNPSHMKAWSFHVLQWLITFLMTKIVSPSVQHCKIIRKASPWSLFVKTPALWFSNLIWFISNYLPICSLNQWYFTAICLDLGFRRGLLSTMIVPWLSLYIWLWRKIELLIVKTKSAKYLLQQIFDQK